MKNLVKVMLLLSTVVVALASCEHSNTPTVSKTLAVTAVVKPYGTQIYVNGSAAKSIALSAISKDTASSSGVTFSSTTANVAIISAPPADPSAYSAGSNIAVLDEASGVITPIASKGSVVTVVATDGSGASGSVDVTLGDLNLVGSTWSAPVSAGQLGTGVPAGTSSVTFEAGTQLNAGTGTSSFTPDGGSPNTSAFNWTAVDGVVKAGMTASVATYSFPDLNTCDVAFSYLDSNGNVTQTIDLTLTRQ